MLFPNEGTLTGSPQHSSCISTGMAKRQVWYREGLAFHARSFESGGPSGHPVQSCGGCIVFSVSFSLLPPKVVVLKALTNSVRTLWPPHTGGGRFGLLWGRGLEKPPPPLLPSFLTHLTQAQPQPHPQQRECHFGLPPLPQDHNVHFIQCWDFIKLSFLRSQKQKERKALPCPTWSLLLLSRFSRVRLCATP